MPRPNRFGEILFEIRELTRIASQVFFKMDLYVMVLEKILWIAYFTVVLLKKSNYNTVEFEDSELKFASLWLKKKSDSFLPFDSIMGLNPDIFP